MNVCVLMFVCECLHAQVVSSLCSNVNVATLVKRGDAVTSLPDVSSSSRLPLPPGAALSLWKNQELFRKLYFSKFPVRFAHFSSTSHLPLKRCPLVVSCYFAASPEESR